MATVLQLIIATSMGSHSLRILSYLDFFTYFSVTLRVLRKTRIQHQLWSALLFFAFIIHAKDFRSHSYVRSSSLLYEDHCIYYQL